MIDRDDVLDEIKIALFARFQTAENDITVWEAADTTICFQERNGLAFRITVVERDPSDADA